mmetsp:Transcript_63324/g.88041  ORF Transcript_63324/g.88041 Transcript_63324/m.88041 type:complete len:210 (-) Transcript_63324:62-691(-)
MDEASEFGRGGRLGHPALHRTARSSALPVAELRADALPPGDFRQQLRQLCAAAAGSLLWPDCASGQHLCRGGFREAPLGGRRAAGLCGAGARRSAAGPSHLGPPQGRPCRCSAPSHAERRCGGRGACGAGGEGSWTAADGLRQAFLGSASQQPAAGLRGCGGCWRRALGHADGAPLPRCGLQRCGPGAADPCGRHLVHVRELDLAGEQL